MVSMAAALVAALCYGIAAVMQAMAVRAASRRTAATNRSRLGTVDPGLVVRMLHQGPFIASLGLDLIGFFAQLVALRQLPLFAAQAIIVGLLVSAVISMTGCIFAPDLLRVMGASPATAGEISFAMPLKGRVRPAQFTNRGA